MTFIDFQGYIFLGIIGIFMGKQYIYIYFFFSGKKRIPWNSWVVWGRRETWHRMINRFSHENREIRSFLNEIWYVYFSLFVKAIPVSDINPYKKLKVAHLSVWISFWGNFLWTKQTIYEYDVLRTGIKNKNLKYAIFHIKYARKKKRKKNFFFFFFGSFYPHKTWKKSSQQALSWMRPFFFFS